MEIVLMRHGPPDFDDSRWLHRHDLSALFAEYAAAHMSTAAPPAAVTVATSLRAGVIVSSNLARSIDSARALGYENILSLPELDEADLPSPAWLRLPMPYRAAVVMARIGWFAGYSPDAESFRETVLRARGAANSLVQLAQRHDIVLVVGHGIMNGLVGRDLVRKGWTREGRGGSGYWSVARFRSATASAARGQQFVTVRLEVRHSGSLQSETDVVNGRERRARARDRRCVGETRARGLTANLARAAMQRWSEG